jgi:hypothetical protein
MAAIKMVNSKQTAQRFIFGVHCLKRRRIDMNRKMHLVLLVAFAGMVMSPGFASCSKKDGSAASREDGGTASLASASEKDSGAVSDTPNREANGPYRIGSKVQVYGGDLKPTDAYFTYSPSTPTNLNYDNAVILNFGPPYIDAALFFGKSNASDADNIGFIRNCIDKSIEWAATARENNVRDLMKVIPFDGYSEDDGIAVYGLNQPNYRRHEPAYLMFSFIVDADGEGKDGPWLVMNYRTHNELRSGATGGFFCFRENVFVHLKEMFSESYLAEIDKQEAAWQKSHTDQDTLFK